MTEKYLVCPKCGEIARGVDLPVAVCYRANEILTKRNCSYKEAVQRALEEFKEDDES